MLNATLVLLLLPLLLLLLLLLCLFIRESTWRLLLAPVTSGTGANSRPTHPYARPWCPGCGDRHSTEGLAASNKNAV
jgi:hypothetical protein